MPSTDLDEVLARIAARRGGRQSLEELAADAPPGLLYRIGRVLDYPGRKVREAITGRREATGRDLLRKLGIAPRERAGLDVGDVASFGAEVATDPLMLLGGVGTLTRGGKAAAALGKTAGTLKAARAARRLATTTKEGTLAEKAIQGILARRARLTKEAAKRGVPETLAKGARAQARAGQRSLLKIQVPFTGIEKTLIKGEGILAGGERVGKILGASRAAQFGRKVFDPKFGRLEETAPYYEEFLGRGVRRGGIQAAEKGEAYGRRLEVLKRKSGLPEGKLIEKLSKGRESLGVPERVGRRVGILKAKTETKLKGYRSAAEARYRENLKRSAGKVNRQAFKRAEELEARAEEALRYGKTRRAASLRQKAQQVLYDASQRMGRITARPVPAGMLGKLAARETAIRGKLGSRLAPIIGKAQAAKGRIKDLSPLERRFVERLTKETGELGRREIQAGAKNQENMLRALTVSYAERVLTPEARKWLKDQGKTPQFLTNLTRAVTTKAGFQKSRQQDLVEVLTAEANDFFLKAGDGRPAQWFNLDPSKSLPIRYLNGETSIAAAKLFTSLADDFSKVGAGSVDDVPLGEFLSAAPIHKYKNIPLSADPAANERRLKALGLGGRTIPKAVAEEATRVMEKLATPESVGQLLGAFDKATSWYRYALTIPWPAFHLRNLFSDTVMSWLNDGADVTVLPQVVRQVRNPAWIKEAEELGIMSGESARWIREQTGILQQGKVGKNFEKFYTRFGEDFSRTWHFLSKKKQGLSDYEAAASVKKALFDYSELTDAEKIIAKRLILFYNWPRKIIPELMRQYAENPAKMALLTRGISQPTIERPAALPEYVRRGAGIPTGRTPEGGLSVIAGTGLPLEELSKFDPSSPEGGILGGVKQLLRRGGEQLNPLLRAPAELATGRDFRTGQEILQQDRAEPILGRIPGLREAIGYREDKLPGGGTRPRADPLALFILKNLPTSRGQQIAGQVTDLFKDIDPRTTSAEQLVRLLSGLQTLDLDPEDLARAVQQSLRERGRSLQRSGDVRSKEILFPTSGPEGVKSAAGADLSEKMRAVEKILEEMRERRQRPSSARAP